MCQYGSAAVKAREYCMTGDMLSPRDAWEKAVSEFTTSEKSRKKGCPRCAFLGLCQEGEVSGISKGNYTTSVKNKGYALKALSLLRDDSSLSDDKTALWQRVKNELHLKRADEGITDVVVSLWSAGFIKLDN